MSQPRKRWREPGFILDAAQVIVFIVVAIVLALDVTGIWTSVPWLSRNLTYLTFIAVCTLIVLSFLERRIILNGLEEITEQKLDQLLLRQQELSKLIKESTSAGIELKDRRGLREPFVVRLAEAQQVDLLGLSLLGIIAHHGGFLLEKANAGCKLRIILVDPDSPAMNAAVGFIESETERKPDIERSIRNLKPLLEAGNVELRLTSVAPPFSLLITDPAKPNGKIQVELYGHAISSTDRPHFVLTQAIDKHWYDFFKEQFNRLWNDARPYRFHGEIIASHPETTIIQNSQG